MQEIDTKGLKIGDKYITKLPVQLSQYKKYSSGHKADLTAFPGEEFIIIGFNHDGTKTSSTSMRNIGEEEKNGTVTIKMAHVPTRLSTIFSYDYFLECFL